LATDFHVIAPDYPGFGNSDMPDPAGFAYTSLAFRSGFRSGPAGRLLWSVSSGLRSCRFLVKRIPDSVHRVSRAAAAGLTKFWRSCGAPVALPKAG
jgi:hypothetical protein